MKDDNYEVSVDEFLAQQSECELLATIEPVEDNQNLVKVTPWYPSAGCLCCYSLNISKGSIESLHLTEDRRGCCGKVLRVVGVRFKEGARVEVSQLFDQLARSAVEATRKPGYTEFAAARGLSRVRPGPRPGSYLPRSSVAFRRPSTMFLIDAGCMDDCIDLGVDFFNACWDPLRDSREKQLQCARIADRIVDNCIEGGGGFAGCYRLVPEVFGF